MRFTSQRFLQQDHQPTTARQISSVYCLYTKASEPVVISGTVLLCPQVTIKGCTGPVNTFVVEPFVPHKEEYYLCIQSNRLDTDVSFSTAGGMDIEENWDKVKTISIATATGITGRKAASCRRVYWVSCVG